MKLLFTVYVQVQVVCLKAVEEEVSSPQLTARRLKQKEKRIHIVLGCVQNIPCAQSPALVNTIQGIANICQHHTTLHTTLCPLLACF